MSLAKELRKFADRLDTPGAATARRLRIPLDRYQLFERIKNLAVIRTVLDVGANRGQFARQAALSFPKAMSHSFEPLAVCEPPLRELAAQFPQLRPHFVALGAVSGVTEMFQNDYSPSSSFLPMQDRHREIWPKTVGAKKCR